MVMRLVRDEPDVQLDEVRAVGAERDATVFTDLAYTRETAAAPMAGLLPPQGPRPAAVPRARKARKPMSRKSPSQVIEVPEFASASEADDDGREPAAAADPGGAAPQVGPEGSVPASSSLSSDPAGLAGPADEMTDGTVPPQERPAAGGRDGGADGADDGDEPGVAEAAVPLATLEALLLSTHHPLTPARLNELLAVGSARAIHQAVRALNDDYERTGRSFRVEQVAGGYQILTLPEHGDALRRLHQREADAKLTKAALETLSIVAYKQPILRADVEAIRGVACGETIRSLMEKHLVKIAGRAEEPGRPILYGTTKRFLELFGLNSLKDLPRPEEFKPPVPSE